MSVPIRSCGPDWPAAAAPAAPASAGTGEFAPRWNPAAMVQRPQRCVFQETGCRRALADKRSQHQARHDPLTGLPNRRDFCERLSEQVALAAAAGASFVLLFIDLDEFKEVNDVLGHVAGDQLLKQAAGRIRARVSDGCLVARIGGDEFTVMVGTGDAERVARSIIAGMQEPFMLGDEQVYVSASIGATRFPEHADNAVDLMKNADQAMYAAKRNGKNCFEEFTEALHRRAQERKTLVKQLRLAIARQQFELVFQPIVELGTGRIAKAEALLRWCHPELGVISPATFVPLAEETGLIVALGDWVYHEATRWARRWQALCPDFQISINVSPRQFYANGTDFTAWLAHLDEIGLAGRHVVVEITEGLLLQANQHVGSRLQQLRQAGVRLAIDDFGTGYSALSYLKTFQVDYLKIDKSFVPKMMVDGPERALSEVIIALARRLGLEVIAEGVEMVEQHQFLNDAGCHFGQGYVYSRPLPPARFEALLGDACRTPAGSSAPALPVSCLS